MLKAKPHLWPYGTNLLVWICEIHFFRQECCLQLPKLDPYLLVSQPVIHVSYILILDFNSLPLIFQVLSCIAEQRLCYFHLHSVAHVFISPSFSSSMFLNRTFCLQARESKRFLGFDMRFCIFGLIGSCLLQLCVEGSTDIGRLIPDSKDLEIQCSNQTTSSCSKYSCLNSHGKAESVRASTVTQLTCWGMMLMTENCFQLHIHCQNNTAFKRKKRKE